MQNKTLKIRTQPLTEKNITVNIEQDFDFLEILSLKIDQKDLYNTFCADYGVLVGRVIANKGFGVPNAKISIFIPVSDEDEKNELINNLYPFRDVTSKNNDGYRYNLFLSEATCNLNTPIGTFPTKGDLVNTFDEGIQLEIFEKYYKYTTRTNEAGDYILFGVPTGQQSVHVDVDLSDIGILSLRPYDLIEQGLPEELFDGYTKYRSSENLDELPQVKSQTKSSDIVPFWGDTERCSFGITRVDFDTGIEIVPSSIFMGSIFTDTKRNSLNKRCNPKNDAGEQCELMTKDGSIDILRVIYDENENPIEIEEFTPRAGKDLIDEDGTYAFNLPMYYDRVVTDEFGNLVPSSEEGVGVPTKGKYRFKIKFTEPPVIRKFTTASLIVPSLNQIHGGTAGTEQQRWTTDITQYDDANQANVGLVFGDSNSPQPADQPKPRTVSSDLDLDFHTFEWKQVYTLSQYIKKYKRGNNRFSFIGIKGCDECDYNNYFPFTTAIKKASFGFFIQSLFIGFLAAIYKILIILGNLRFCSYVRFTGSGRCRRLADFAPFGFILGIFENPIELECGDEPYYVDPYCGGVQGCTCDGNAVQTGPGTGNTPCCPDSNGTNCDTDACLKFTVFVPNENNCTSLNQLEQWKCCARYVAAKENKAIKFTFFDAWLNGSAYLFQFKNKVRFKNDGTTKSKFCGPGSTNLGGDNYAGYNAFSTFFGGSQFDFRNNTCNAGHCLILGPSIDPADRNYVGGVQGGSPEIRTTLNTPGIPNGANDANEFLYCNWVSSTKIVSLGRMEMCEDTFVDIKNCISTNTQNDLGNTIFDCSISDLRLGDKNNPYTGDNLGPLSPYNIPTTYTTQNPPNVIKVGTGGENGFDRQETLKKLTETSYEDPQDVFIYLLRQTNCNVNKLFLNIGENTAKCHELELYQEYQEPVREVCKEHNTIVTIPAPLVSGGYDYDNPGVWDVTGIASTIDPEEENGPFAIDPLIRDRYHPNTDNHSGNDPENVNILDTGHIDPKTNMPYFYFGLKPGKSAIDKYRQKYLI
jgi:hypothetical protein